MESKLTKQAQAVADWHMTDDLHVQHGKGDPFAAAIRATRMAMLITDPRLPDNPIVFANDAFLRLTGYDRSEVMGSNCRFLQGPETDPASVEQIRHALANRTDVAVDVLNYRKDGTSFWNALYISPVSNETGELQFFFASQLDVSDRKLSEDRVRADKRRFERAVKQRTRELEAALDAQTTLLHEVDHRVKNNLQMIASLIVMQMREIKDKATLASLSTMRERIEALGTVHRRLYQSEDVSSFDLAEFIRDLVSDVVEASGRSEISTELDLSPVVISAQKATPVALMVNELVTNALKHAFKGKADGSFKGIIGVRLSQQDDKIIMDVTDDGVGILDEPGDSFGTKLVRSLARQLDADIGWHNTSPGTRVSISMPATKLTSQPDRKNNDRTAENTDR